MPFIYSFRIIRSVNALNSKNQRAQSAATDGVRSLEMKEESQKQVTSSHEMVVAAPKVLENRFMEEIQETKAEAESGKALLAHKELQKMSQGALWQVQKELWWRG